MTTHDNVDYDKYDFYLFCYGRKPNLIERVLRWWRWAMRWWLRFRGVKLTKDNFEIVNGHKIYSARYPYGLRAKTKVTVITDTRGNTHEITPSDCGL
jgi:hypothetical protein